MSLKGKIESVLYTSDKPMKAQAIAEIIHEDVQLVRQTILELIREYEERDGGLEISDDNGYSFQVKEPYSDIMNDFLPIEMSAALIRTLSAIAIKQPIAQSEIIRVRGAGAYEHIRELVEKDLISKKDEGRSPELTTTKKFQEYFRLSKDGKSLREILIKQEKKLAKAEADAAAGGEGDLPVDGSSGDVQLTIGSIGEGQAPGEGSDAPDASNAPENLEVLLETASAQIEKDAISASESEDSSSQDTAEEDEESFEANDEDAKESKDDHEITSFAPPDAITQEL